MSEILSNNLEPVLKGVLEDSVLTPEEAKKILDVYEANKTGMLRYTKEGLTSLRKSLGVDSREGLFGMPEITALRKIVGVSVTKILTLPAELSRPPLQKSETSKSGILSPDISPKGPIPLQEVLLARENYEKIQGEIWPTLKLICPLVGMSPEKILAICAHESRFNTQGRSEKGAAGLMQVMPATMRGVSRFLKTGGLMNAGPEEKYYAQVRETAKEKGFDINGFLDTTTPIGRNIVIGTLYISYLTGKYDEVTALRMYNGGGIKNSRENRNYASGVKAWQDIIVATAQSSDTQFS